MALGAQHRGGSEGPCWVSSAPTISAGGGQHQDSVVGCCGTGGFWQPARCRLQRGTPGVCANPYFLGTNVSRTQTSWESPGLVGTNLLPPAVTRGDVFALPEDDYLDYNLTVDLGTEPSIEAAPTELPTAPLPVQPTPENKPGPEETLTEAPSTTADGLGEWDPVEETEELCSGKPFDAFTDLKNGSLYAFRGTSGTFPGHVGRAAVLSPHAGGRGRSCRSHLPSLPREVLL